MVALRRSKYGVRTDRAGVERRTVDGVTFASQKEAHRYLELRASLRTGLITDLELQPRFPLYVSNVKIGTYIADFRYRSKAGEIVIEDVKSAGTKTAVYRLKKKIFEAMYPFKILET